MSVEIFAFRGGSNLYNYAAAWTRLRPRFRARSYDLIHAHFVHSGLLALPKRLPLVVTLRERDLGVWAKAGPPPTAAAYVRSFLARWIARRADAVIVNNEALRPRLGKRARVHVIPFDLEEAARTARLIEVYSSVLGKT
jgi:hypothetical protein